MSKSSELFEKHIKPRWQGWNPELIEVQDWSFMLTKYEEEDIQRAVFEYLQKYEKYKEPKMNKMISILKGIRQKRLSKQRTPEYSEPVLVFSLVSEDNSSDKRRFYCKNQEEFRSRTPESIRNEAQVKKEKHKNLYGGEWRVIIN